MYWDQESFDEKKTGGEKFSGTVLLRGWAAESKLKRPVPRLRLNIYRLSLTPDSIRWTIPFQRVLLPVLLIRSVRAGNLYCETGHFAIVYSVLGVCGGMCR